MLAGALELLPSTGDQVGPDLVLSYDRDPTAVGAGGLTIRLDSSESLPVAPLLSVDRPGGGNDLVKVPMTRDGSGLR